MNFCPIIPNDPCPAFHFWKSDFPEFRILVFYQIGISFCLWVLVSVNTVGLAGAGISKPGEAVNFLEQRAWFFVCGVGTTAYLIHFVFATILHKGVHENRMEYVAVWLMFVFICWIGLVVQLLFSTPWISVNAVVATLSTTLLLPAFYGLRSIQLRKKRNWTLSTHC